MRAKRVLAAATAAAALAGCGGRSIPASYGSVPDTAPAAAGGFPVARSVYVGLQPGSVAVYAPGAAGLRATIVRGVVVPSALAFGPQRMLFVANQRPASSSRSCPAGGSVRAYPAGSSISVATTSRGIVCPLALAYSGALYVLNLNRTVTVYAVKKTAARTALVYQRTIRSGIIAPQTMTVDRSGNLYIANATVASGAASGSVAAYRAGSGTPAYTLPFSNLAPTALVTDRSGDLYVGASTPYANTSALQSCVSEYAPFSTHLLRQFCGGNVISALAVDSRNNLYVGVFSAASSSGSVGYAGLIVVYPPAGNTVLRQIKMIAPQMIALDSIGTLYAVDCGGGGCGRNSTTSSSGMMLRVVAPNSTTIVRSVALSGTPTALATEP
jgi:hypothetical protein